MSNLTPIERKEGVTIYGRIIDGKAKLGQYEVHSIYEKYDGTVQQSYADAEKKMKAIIGVFVGKN